MRYLAGAIVLLMFASSAFAQSNAEWRASGANTPMTGGWNIIGADECAPLNVYQVQDPMTTLQCIEDKFDAHCTVPGDAEYGIGLFSHSPNSPSVRFTNYSGCAPIGATETGAIMYTLDPDCNEASEINPVTLKCLAYEEEHTLTPMLVQNCPATDRTNPCDLATGNKLETETDYAALSSGGLIFQRHYNSMGPYRSGVNFAHGWRHTYSRALDEMPDKYDLPTFAASGSRSDPYSSEQAACETGWGDIKDTVWGGDISTATATFAGGNLCEISEGGSVTAYFAVQSTTARAAFTGPATIRTITRPNGGVYQFRQSGGNWVNELVPSVKLEESGSDWVFTDSDDTRETYNSSGQLVSIEYRNTQTETLDYNLTAAQGGDDNPDTLDRVTGPFGHELLFDYDASGRLATVTTPDGAITYAYDANDNLEFVTYPDAAVRQYLYEDVGLPNHLTGIIDENTDRYSTYAYDTEGRGTLSERVGGLDSATIAYNVDGTTTLTLGNGATRTYWFDVEQGDRKTTLVTGDVCSMCPGGNVMDRVYDANGFTDEVIDWEGNTTQTIRNAEGLIETRVEAKGSTEERTTTTSWHPTYRLPSQTVSPRNTTDYTYDADGNMLTLTVSSGSLSRVWTMTYNAFGQPLTIDGPRTDVIDVTTIQYHSCTTGSECGQISSVTNAASHVTTYDTYDAAGRMTQMTDPNGLVTTFGYDVRGNLETVTETPTVGIARTTTMTYDDANQLKTVSTPDGAVLTYTYTDAHYLESLEDNFGNRIEYGYDSMGNVSDMDTYDSGAVLKRAIDYVYDLNNRVDTVNAGGFTTDLLFDDLGNLDNEVDPNTASTTHSQDALNRLTQTVDALSNTISYGYDDHDNLTSVTAGNNALTSYVYDDLDNLTQEVSPDRGTTTYTHDDAGNVVTMLDARGRLTTYDYDELNRLTLETLHGGSTITYEYDIGTNAIGRLNRIIDPSGQTAWSYSNFGEVTSKTQTIGAVALTVGYSYDSAGRLATMTLPSGKVVTYGYDTYLPVSVSVDGNTILSGATYDPFGPVTGWTWGDSSTSSRAYDLRGLPTTVTIAGETRTHGYDPAGYMTSQLDSTINIGFDHDLLGRITDFTNNNPVGGPAGPMFSSPPAILASTQTTNNEATPGKGNATPWITPAVRNVGSASVQLALGRGEVNTGSITSSETIGYVAVEGGSSGSFSANGTTISYVGQTTSDSIRGWGNGCYTTNFLTPFSANPVVIGTINRHDGGDGGWARQCSLSSSAVGYTIDEDQYRDSERNHTTEAVGFMAFSESFDAEFTDATGTWKMEAGTFPMPAMSAGPVVNVVGPVFRQTYSVPPIVILSATDQNGDPADVRVYSVSTTGFTGRSEEPANADGNIDSITLHYIAIEPGVHELPDGARILAGSVSTTSQQHGSGVTGAESWETVTFPDWPGGNGLPASQVFDYDGNGSRESLTEDSIFYNYTNQALSNRLLSTQGPTAKTYTYDAAGNVIGDGINTYGYDDRGRLVDVNTGAATYVHNGLGQRVSKDNGSVSLFIYDQVGNVLGEYDAVGNAVQEHIWLKGAPVAVLAGVNRYFVHTDHLGTPRAISDAGTVIWRWESDPFGSVLAQEDADGDLTLFTYNLRFPGQYYDSETGLHYNYFRTYDPATGRYVQSDPIGIYGGINTFAYVGGNPISYTDRYGLVHPAAVATGREVVRRCLGSKACSVGVGGTIALALICISSPDLCAAAANEIASDLGALSDIHVGPWPNSTTRPGADAAGEEAADEVLEEIGGACDTDDIEGCKRAARLCKEKCLEKSEDGYGGSWRDWFARCHQVCTDRVGCGNFFK